MTDHQTYLEEFVTVMTGHALNDYPDELIVGVGWALAEIEKLRVEGTPGVMHAVDKAFYDLTVKQRNAAWAKVKELRATREQDAEDFEAMRKRMDKLRAERDEEIREHDISRAECVRAEERAERAEGLARELAALLRRIRAWDHLPHTGDGPYWMREIDALLARHDELRKESER